MAKLLYIQASPRGEHSKSNTVADAFIEAYRNANPQDKIEILNIFSADLPGFDGLTVQAKYTILHGKEHSNEELKAWREVEAIIEHFKSVDKYVVSIPMWNFSIPYRLKQYIDIIVQPGYTFSFDQKQGYSGLVKGKPLLTVYARGGAYGEGSGSESLDMQSKYIELIFGFIGFEDIRSIIVEPTLQGGPETAQKKLAEAVDKAKKIASYF